MAEASTLTDALTILQDAQKALIDAKVALVTHNDDEDAHQAIQDRIKKLENDDNIYSNDEIEDLIEKQLDAHAAQDFRTAHANWEGWYEGYQNTITSIYTRLTNLEKKDTSEDKTDLDATLAAIEEKYAAQLESLQKAFKAAQDQGQTELADMYKENIQKTLDAKSKEIMEAIEAWQKEHGTSTDDSTDSKA